MKLHENQLRLIWHLCRFSLLDYESCLYLLDTEIGWRCPMRSGH